MTLKIMLKVIGTLKASSVLDRAGFYGLSTGIINKYLNQNTYTKLNKVKWKK